MIQTSEIRAVKASLSVYSKTVRPSDSPEKMFYLLLKNFCYERDCENLLRRKVLAGCEYCLSWFLDECMCANISGYPCCKSALSN